MSTYIAIDMKSFYASVECVARGLDPLKANAILKGINFLEGATTRERNTQIGGHRA